MLARARSKLIAGALCALSGVLVLGVPIGASARSAPGAQVVPRGGLVRGGSISEGAAAPRGVESDSESSTAALAGSRWYEAGTDAGWTWNCTILGGGYPEPLGRSWVGWYGEIGVNPQVGNVYYTKVGWGVSGFPCGNGGARVHVEIGLPANTQLAISSTNKVRCFYQSPRASTMSEFTSDPDCPQQPQAGIKGGLSFDPAGPEAAWPTATGSIFELWIPVKTTTQLSGLITNPPCPSCFIAGVWMIDGVNSPWSYPQTGIGVVGGTPASPSIGYPVPSVRNLNYNPDDPNRPDGLESYGETWGYLYTEGTTGTFYFQIGPTTSYGTTSPVYSVNTPGNYEAFQGWYMTPGETWHWRLCYDQNGAGAAPGVICGRDQTFETEPPPDTTAPNTSIKTGPSGPTASTKATFTFGSSELNVTYLCKLDGGEFLPCDLVTKPMYSGLSQGSHTLSVKAKDAAGNIDPTPAQRSWIVDTIKPNTTITSGPSGTVSSRKAVFKFSSSEGGGRFLCSLDGKRFRACSSPKTYTDLTRGSHTFKVKAKDAAGNVDGTPAARSWKVG